MSSDEYGVDTSFVGGLQRDNNKGGNWMSGERCQPSLPQPYHCPTID
jgi:hypothetical protein